MMSHLRAATSRFEKLIQSSFVIPLALVLGLFMSSANSYAVSLTWTNGSDFFTSTTAWQTNTSTGLDPVGLTNINCVAELPSGSTFVTNCVGGNGAPSSGDNVSFTNNANYTVSFASSVADIANATFSSPGGVVTLKVGSSTWGITNRLYIGRGVGSTSTVYIAGGTIDVENFVSARPEIGSGSADDYCYGALFVTNGLIIADFVNIGNGTNNSGKMVISGSGVVTNTGLANNWALGAGGF